MRGMTRFLFVVALTGAAILSQAVLAQTAPAPYGSQAPYGVQPPPYGSQPSPAPTTGYQDPNYQAPASGAPSTYTANELVNEGHRVFGNVSQNLATVVEHAVSRYGLPNGYILGQEAGGAFIGGARYGEGVLYTKNAGQHRVYWQGPSIGFDVGANGNRTMMLIYNLPSVEAMYQRFLGVNGSAYIVAGLGMTVLTRNDIYVVPIVSGVGARLGVNLGYLKFTDNRTWNPF